MVEKNVDINIALYFRMTRAGMKMRKGANEMNPLIDILTKQPPDRDTIGCHNGFRCGQVLYTA